VPAAAVRQVPDGDEQLNSQENSQDLSNLALLGGGRNLTV
jgi:hypothetical protein